MYRQSHFYSTSSAWSKLPDLVSHVFIWFCCVFVHYFLIPSLLYLFLLFLELLLDEC